MRPDLLHVIVPVFNPLRNRSHTRNTARFLLHMIESGVRVMVVEATYGDAAPVFAGVKGIQHVHVQAFSVCWIKECLYNIGIQHLPRDWKVVGLFDGDIRFKRHDWAAEAVYASQHHPVLQPWEHCHDLGPEGEFMEVHYSFCRQWEKEPESVGRHGDGPYRFAHPGFAWVYTRDALEKIGGLIETAVLGAADHHQALALVGMAKDSLPGGLTDAYAKPIFQWEARCNQHIAGNIGFVPGTIEHDYHGQKAARGYVSRWDILKRHAFDPTTDLKRNTSGVWELAGNKPGLRRDILAYFKSRNEDHTTIRAERMREAA